MGETHLPIPMRAHAKLNLALSVGAPIDAPGQATHGYHPICSYMHAIDLADEIEIAPLPAGRESVYDIAWRMPDGSTRRVEWACGEDLTARVHQALCARVGRKLPCRVTVRKSIPAGGGLGGGSSDAACVLMGLNRCFDLGLSRSELVEVSSTVGSDIAYFIDPGRTPPRPAVVSGLGSAVQRQVTRHAGSEVTLILPPFGCSTGAVYRAFDERCGRRRPNEQRVRVLVGAGELVDELLFNDLDEPAARVAGQLGPLRSALSSRLGRAVHMSGSGSTLFVLGRVDPLSVHDVDPECRVVHTRLV